MFDCRKMPCLSIYFSSIVLALALATTAAMASDTSDKYMARRGETRSLSTYEAALDLMQKGDCDKAEQVLDSTLKEGAGNEVAQADMGYCYLQKASKVANPEEAKTLRGIGINWILLAAGAGQRRAQQELVTQYLDGGALAVDRQEAAKWFLLWKANHSNLQVSPSEFDEKLEEKLRAVLTPEDWEVARKRAEAWQPATR